MPRPRDDARVIAMYGRYQEGASLAAIAAAYGISRQSVHSAFKLRSLPLRPQAPILRPCVAWGGHTWTLKADGYYYRTRRPRSSLHRAVWIERHGIPPAGMVVHHRNHDKSDNRIENLCLMPAPAHTAHHSTIEVVPRRCRRCGAWIERRRWAGGILENPARYNARKICLRCWRPGAMLALGRTP